MIISILYIVFFLSFPTVFCHSGSPEALINNSRTNGWSRFGFRFVQQGGSSDQLDMNERIVGGNQATLGQFPFQVLIRLFQQGGGIGNCGGSLITRRFVLTAAHCLDGSIAAIVTLGALRSSQLFGKGVISYMMSANNLIIHPFYDASEIKNDIGLIRLPQLVKLGPTIRLIKLPGKMYSDPTAYCGQNGIASGWGMLDDDNDNLPEYLQETTLKIASHKECKHFFSQYLYEIDDTQICTEFNGSSTCYGDSGGPLISTTLPQILIGVTSFGMQKCTDNAPSVYTNVAAYIDWIRNNTIL